MLCFSSIKNSYLCLFSFIFIPNITTPPQFCQQHVVRNLCSRLLILYYFMEAIACLIFILLPNPISWLRAKVTSAFILLCFRVFRTRVDSREKTTSHAETVIFARLTPNTTDLTGNNRKRQSKLYHENNANDKNPLRLTPPPSQKKKTLTILN